MNNRHPVPGFLCAAVLAAAIAWGISRPLPAAGGETEFIRGTVHIFRPGSLALIDVTLQNGESAGTPVMVIVNDETEYFDGPLRASRESVCEGLKVLVKCEPAGPGRTAILVRIVGGKAP